MSGASGGVRLYRRVMYYAVMTANVTPVDSQCPNYPSNHRLQINLCSEAAAPQQQHNGPPTLSTAGCAGIPAAAQHTQRCASRLAQLRCAGLASTSQPPQQQQRQQQQRTSFNTQEEFLYLSLTELTN